MFVQKIFPEGYNYIEPTCSKEELFEILTKKCEEHEPVEGKLIYLSTDYTYGIIYFGSDNYGYILGNNIRDFKPEFARCLQNQIIKVNLLYFDETKKQFICSRKELIEQARVSMDNKYKIGFHLICKILYVNPIANFTLIDIGQGRTVKIPNSDLNGKTYSQGEFDTFTIKSMSKSKISKHQVFTLTNEKDVGVILPIIFKTLIGNKWYGLVEESKEYPLGEIYGLHQKAVYEVGDCHIAMIAGYAHNNAPIYKLI